MYNKKKPEDLDCGIEVAAKVFGGKWKPCILDSIVKGNHRPSQIHRYLSTASPRVINIQLRELENYKVVQKKVFPGLPPRVEYYLTESGKKILPIIALMERWGNQNKEEVRKISETLVLMDSVKLAGGKAPNQG